MHNRSPKSYIKKFNIQKTNFYYHRDGWKIASESLSKFNNANGILFFEWADKVFKNEIIIKKPWSGIFHNVLVYPEEYKEKYKNKINCLSELVKKDYFLKSLEKCIGIFTLCKHTADFLNRNLDIPIKNLKHPVGFNFPNFDYKNFTYKITTIGQWLRKYHSICEIKADNWQKQIIKTPGFDSDYILMKRYNNCENCIFLSNLNNGEYDDLLSKSIIFLELYDVAACNVLLECISRNTPILINPLPAVVEYLGTEYPFYFQSIEEAQNKLNKKNILETHDYLVNLDKSSLSQEYFMNEFYESKIYNRVKIF